MWLTAGEWGGPKDGETRRDAAWSATAPSATCPAPARSTPTRPRSDDGHHRDRRLPAHRARRHPRRRQAVRGRHGRPQARGVLLDDAPPTEQPSSATSLLRFATAGSVDDGKSTLVGRLLHDSKSVLADQLEAVERGLARPRPGRRPTSRCSPTACAPSASRASPSTSPTATSPPPARGSSSPTPPGTCSTPATWSPAPPPPSSPWCWSTPATASSSRPAGTPPSPRCCGCRTSCSRSTRWTWSTTRSRSSPRSPTSSPRTPPRSASPRSPRSRSRALAGDNVVDPLRRTWTGTAARPCWSTWRPSPVGADPTDAPARFPVQYVIRPQTAEHPDYRGYAGQIASGVLRVGDAVTVLPSGAHQHRRRDRRARRAGRGRLGAAVGDASCSPTTSTSRAAT